MKPFRTWGFFMSELIFRRFHRCQIEMLAHGDQRYDTCGDWWEDAEGAWHIRVSATADWRYAFLVALHELVEMGLCLYRNIPEDAVTAFDVKYEAQRPTGDTSEPGDDPHAPYREEHQVATSIERQVALELGVDWDVYTQILLELHP